MDPVKQAEVTQYIKDRLHEDLRDRGWTEGQIEELDMKLAEILADFSRGS